jgi:hypothetical protein
VLDHCQFINGPEVRKLERRARGVLRRAHVVSCASGTDALLMVLMAKGIGRGDAVLCPSFTFCATGEAVALTGATPVFVDVDEATFNIDPAARSSARIATAKQARAQAEGGDPGRSVRPKPPTTTRSPRSRKPKGLFVLDDAAQGSARPTRAARSARSAGHRDQLLSRPSRSAATATAARSSPTTTSSPRRCAACASRPGRRQIRQCAHRLTGRLDTMQAAVLIEKLKIFEDEIAARNAVARRYARGARQCRDRAACRRTAAPRSGRNTPSACRRRTTRRLCRRAEGAGHSDRDLLSEADASADRLPGFPVAEGGLPVSEKLGRGHQPADARLSRRADAGADHRGCARRAFGMIPAFEKWFPAFRIIRPGF